MPTQYDDVGEWATGQVPSQGEPALSPAQIEEIVDNVMITLGTLHTDPGTLPGSATVRPRGAFTLPDDLRIYLDNGGLLVYDAGGGFIPSPIVHILKRPQAGGPHTIYEVWIDEES